MPARKISLLEPVIGLPDLVFTANAAMIFRKQALISRFRHRQRQGEEPYNRRWLAENGFDSRRSALKISASKAPATPSSAAIRSTPATACEATPPATSKSARMLGCRVIPVELVDARYYHLDTCFCPLAAGEAIWYPPAFDEYGQRAIREHVPNLIEVEQTEAERFACNAVVIGRRVITNTGCDQLHAVLASRGYDPVATPLDEFVKAGGSANASRSASTAKKPRRGALEERYSAARAPGTIAPNGVDSMRSELPLAQVRRHESLMRDS